MIKFNQVVCNQRINQFGHLMHSRLFVNFQHMSCIKSYLCVDKDADHLCSNLNPTFQASSVIS